MDNSAKEIAFDEKGVCNFCKEAQDQLAGVRLVGGLKVLPSLVKEWKTEKNYDVLIGLSGGVDSSYALVKAVELGLRPLCFTVDNGWNTKKADENIMRLVEGLQVPFIRYTIDIPKFRELQACFMKAGVPNIEIPTDHILMAVSLEMASKYGIKTIISGGNVATESIMPPSWGYSARDLTHIKAIYKKFTKKNLKGLPVCGILKWNWYRWVKKIKTVYLLDYMNYNRLEAENYLIDTYGFQSTGEKHEESYFTRWFQSWYLFEKFGIDKRKPHYSSLINSGQMTRDQALDKLQANPVYPQFGIEAKVLKYKKHKHGDYPMDKTYDLIAKLIKRVSS